MCNYIQANNLFHSVPVAEFEKHFFSSSAENKLVIYLEMWPSVHEKSLMTWLVWSEWYLLSKDNRLKLIYIFLDIMVLEDGKSKNHLSDLLL